MKQVPNRSELLYRTSTLWDESASQVDAEAAGAATVGHAKAQPLAVLPGPPTLALTDVRGAPAAAVAIVVELAARGRRRRRRRLGRARWAGRREAVGTRDAVPALLAGRSCALEPADLRAASDVEEGAAAAVVRAEATALRRRADLGPRTGE